MASKPTHVALFAGPGMGLVIPNLVLARRLATLDDHLQITLFIIATDASRSTQLPVATLEPANLHIIMLPPPDVSAILPPDAKVVSRMSVTIRASLPSLRSSLSALSPPPAVLILPLFSVSAMDVADELNMSKYLYFTSSADMLAFMMHLPALDREIQGQYVDQPEPIKVPGCKPIEIEDLVSPVLDRGDKGYRLFLELAKAFPLADGLLINTCEVVDASALNALRTEKAFVDMKIPKLYPIGPLTGPPEDERVPWLDSQPDESVLYVSFGSGGTLSVEQTKALAEGLGKSGQRFLWVSRPPSLEDPSASYLSRAQDSDDPATYLPEGFLERTKNVGLVMRSWAPQVSVLSHRAVAAFLTHGGWSSVLECLLQGKPMIVWPLFAEQGMNAAKLEEMGVGKRVRGKGRGRGGGKAVVGVEEVEEAVRAVVVGEEGKEMRRRAVEAKEKMLWGLEEEEGGPSHTCLVEAVNEWKRRAASRA